MMNSSTTANSVWTLSQGGEIIALDTKSRDDFLQKIKTMLESHQ